MASIITTGEGIPVHYLGVGQLLDSYGHKYHEHIYNRMSDVPWPVPGYCNNAQGCHDWCSDKHGSGPNAELEGHFPENLVGFSFYEENNYDIGYGDWACYCYLRHADSEETTGELNKIPSYGHTYCLVCHSETRVLLSSNESPSDQPPFFFDGIESAESMRQGHFNVMWDFPSYDDGEIVDLETVRYHIMCSVGRFDFAAALKSISAEELIGEFESNSFLYDEIGYILVENGESFDYSLDSVFYGEIHTLFVIAELDGVFSSNSEATELVSSEFDPVVNEELHIVGVFIPTEHLNITLSTNTKRLKFEGMLRSEHLDLMVGDYVVGFTSNLNLFCLHIVEVTTSTKSKVVLVTGEAKVEEIYKYIDYEASIGISRPHKVQHSPSSRRKHRHLIVRRAIRRLGWFQDAWDGLVDAVEDTVNWIGDAAQTVANTVADVFDNLVKVFTEGKVEETFQLIAFDEQIDWQAPGNNGQVKGRVQARSDVFVMIKVSLSSPYLSAEAGWRAEYSADFDSTFTGDVQIDAYERTVWEGKKQPKTFFVGIVPVILDATPKLDIKFQVAVFTKSRIRMGGKGKAELTLYADTSPKLTPSFGGPTFEPYFQFDIDKKVGVDIGLYAVPKIEVNLYLGVVQGELSVGLGPRINIELDLAAIASGAIQLEDLDIEFMVYGEVGVGTVFSSSLRADTRLFEQLWKTSADNTNFITEDSSPNNLGVSSCPGFNGEEIRGYTSRSSLERDLINYIELYDGSPSKKRTKFKICPNTVFDFASEPPLVLVTPLLNQIEILCIAVNDKTNSCTFTGGNTHLLVKSADDANDLLNDKITISGITFRNAQQSSVLMNDPSAQVSFKDCLWENNAGTAAIIIDGAATLFGRRMLRSSQYTRDLSFEGKNETEKESIILRQLDSDRKEKPKSVIEINKCSFIGNTGRSTIIITSYSSKKDGKTKALEHSIYLSLKDTTFTFEDVQGSIIDNYGGKFQSSDCIFEKNTAESIIKSEKATVELYGTMFMNNDVFGEDDGGILFLDDATHMRRSKDNCAKKSSKICNGILYDDGTCEPFDECKRNRNKETGKNKKDKQKKKKKKSE